MLLSRSPQSPIRVLIIGAHGRLGQVAVAALRRDPQFHLVAELGRGDDLRQACAERKPDVGLELTGPDAVFTHAQWFLEAGVRPVIGASGLTEADLTQLMALAQRLACGGLVVPNFSLAMVLMMRYAQDARRYFPDVEMIEMHHPQKKDAPSGTAYHTARMLASQEVEQTVRPVEDADKRILLPGCRGGVHKGIPIHSIRLPGCLAHQQVLFGREGERLTLSADTFSNTSYQPGIVLACKAVMGLKTLKVGLDQVMGEIQ